MSSRVFFRFSPKAPKVSLKGNAPTPSPTPREGRWLARRFRRNNPKTQADLKIFRRPERDNRALAFFLAFKPLRASLGEPIAPHSEPFFRLQPPLPLSPFQGTRDHA